MKMNRFDVTEGLIIISIAMIVAAMLIGTFRENGNGSIPEHINFCDDKTPGKVYVWSNYEYHRQKLSEFQENNNVEIISVTQDDEIFSYHVKCLGD